MGLNETPINLPLMGLRTGTMQMDHKRLIELGLGYKGTSLRYPFTMELPVLYVRERMFALLGKQQGVESVNLKTSPHEAWSQRETYPGAVIPGYHMNKQHWNTVILNGAVPDAVVVDMLEESYRRVVAKLPRADRNGLV
jgi:predicted DNA-binding protein (MmcQ/YjbR family)